jgi:acyl carrier protein
MEKEFITRVKDVLDINDREISLNDTFRNYPEWSSLAALSMIAMIDEEYGVVIDTAEFRKLITLSELLKAIENRNN